jgi:hypothetical protein
VAFLNLNLRWRIPNASLFRPRAALRFLCITMNFTSCKPSHVSAMLQGVTYRYLVSD